MDALFGQDTENGPRSPAWSAGRRVRASRAAVRPARAARSPRRTGYARRPRPPFSTTQIAASGASCFSRIAAARPEGPAPTITTSNSICSRVALSDMLPSAAQDNAAYARYADRQRCAKPGPRRSCGMDALSALRLHMEWGADEALAEAPVDRLAARPPAAPPAPRLPSRPPPGPSRRRRARPPRATAPSAPLARAQAVAAAAKPSRNCARRWPPSMAARCRPPPPTWFRRRQPRLPA